MAAVTGVLTKNTEFAGTYKVVCITGAVAAASDTITLTEATHGISGITAVMGAVLAAPNEQVSTIGVSASGLVLTVTALEGDGTDATTFGNQYAITVLGTVA